MVVQPGNVRSKHLCIQCGAGRGTTTSLFCKQCKPPKPVKPSWRKRRAELAQGLTKGQWRAILVAYKHSCAYCGQRLPRLQQEHIIPIAKGGKHEPSNVVPACWPCKKRKGTILLESMLKLRLMM